MRILTIALFASSTVLATVAFTEDTAHACGGCFVPPNEITAVDSHRMVIAVGQTETVLWDQIVYSGSPEEFVWVLPIPTPEVVVEIADNQFFDDLDRQTAPVIQPLSAPPFCAQSNSAACGGAVAASDGGYTPTDGVTVYDHGVVGPYETVTLGAENPDALYSWLGDNGFAVTQDAVPAMDYYIGLQHAFVIMRLRPGEDVGAMQPVRVRYPGFMGNFPLRMVVVGAQGVLDLSLWIVAEQRYDAQNYGTVTIDQSRLSWDWSSNTSNYSVLFDDTVQEYGNRAWIAEFAGSLGMLDLGGGEDVEILWSEVPLPYVTRLRTRMLVDHIDEDMILAPSESVGDVDNFLFAPIDINYPENPCGSSADDEGLYCTLGLGSGKDAAFLGLVMILGLALVLRRPERRGRRRLVTGRIAPDGAASDQPV